MPETVEDIAEFTDAPRWERVCIVGTGLLGGSIGLALKAKKLADHVVGVGRRIETLKTAETQGCLDSAMQSLADGVTGADLIILATPIRTLHRLLDELGDLDLGNALITDVGSTKTSIVRQAQAVLNEPENFVGSHPMAGGEQHGPSFARADLFGNKPCILTPAAYQSPEPVARIAAFWESLGMHVRQMTPEAHDAAAATISHVPHAVAAMLVQLAEEGNALDIASTGFADVTRVASGDPVVWSDIVTDNATAICDALDQLEAAIHTFRQRTQAGEPQAMIDFFKKAKATRDAWVHGRKSGQ